MSSDTLRRWAHGLVLVASMLLIGDLFLAWQQAGVRVTGVADIHATSNGWSGWGRVAGLAALANVVVELGHLRGRPERPVLTLTAAFAALAATVLASCITSARVAFPGTGAVIEASATRWPAWAGLALAGLAAAASLGVFATTSTRSRRDRHIAPHAPA